MKLTEHVVDGDGIVGCPNLGDVDVARCLVCPGFESIVRAGPLRVVRCRPHVRALAGHRPSKAQSRWAPLGFPQG